MGGHFQYPCKPIILSPGHKYNVMKTEPKLIISPMLLDNYRMILPKNHRSKNNNSKRDFRRIYTCVNECGNTCS